MEDRKQTRVEIMRRLLNKKKQELLKRMRSDAYDKLGQDYKSDFQGGMDEADLAVIQSTQLLGVRLLDMKQNELGHLDRALRKLEEGTYGTCEDCGDEISKRRLQAVFHAVHCIKCAEKGEERQ